MGNPLASFFNTTKTDEEKETIKEHNEELYKKSEDEAESKIKKINFDTEEKFEDDFFDKATIKLAEDILDGKNVEIKHKNKAEGMSDKKLSIVERARLKAKTETIVELEPAKVEDDLSFSDDEETIVENELPEKIPPVKEFPKEKLIVEEKKIALKKHRFNLPEKGFTESEKENLINEAEQHYEKFMDVLMPGWKNDINSKDTPHRVTKAFVEDIMKGLYNPPPKITQFDNIDRYEGLVVQNNIPVKSLCAHHHQNIFGKASVAYIPSPDGKIIGLSKLNRIVEYYSRTPQVQENLTQQIHDAVNELIVGNIGVAVMIIAKHNCVGHRGINQDSNMSTAVLSGVFKNNPMVRDELYKLIEYAK